MFRAMIRGIDHIVIVVGDLEKATAGYTESGFSVVRGGRHARLNTHNALIAFSDGCYLELIAFIGSAPAQHWWYQVLVRGEGLADFCVQSDRLEEDTAAFRNAGALITAPFAMGRVRPDGFRIDWELAANNGDTRGVVPFFIRDITPREERVPRIRTHNNLAAGLESITIAVAELNSVRPIYETALGVRGEAVERDELGAAGVGFALGPHQLQLIAPVNSSGIAAQRLRTHGPSPIEVKLKAHGAIGSLLDLRRVHGARIVLVS
jgi:catechol 2,3-dioxygenase-like lactoylglutathione lyase family enzyme